jgi:hypothetical protein
MQDQYIWSVIYVDGTVMGEYGRVEGRGFAEIGDKHVKALDIEPLPQHLHAHRILVPDGAQPVFFRRRTIALDGSANEQGRSTVHCIGWKQEESAVYLFVFEDGSTLLSDDLQAV